MDEQQSIPSVAETIAAFRGISTERTHDEQYNQEIYTQVIRQLIRRVDTREQRIYPSRTIDRTRIRATPDDIPRTGNEVTKRLALAILPAFKQKLKSLPLLMKEDNCDEEEDEPDGEE
ncbi:hypothetical protein PCANC_00713 [Puccinia coronata f. sp. avenae]|uniref:Uncharacterized protein n=1 Tax=Puccinia coronata f. sp. avenae TaxID=200324 RepID=A0A2N5U6P2_9BASI|nr:hypothetical protein PCASD_17347 [Puccinia coronata f. sp. avenae]PLW58021.1 hypothetical protein PCANC_00713 [Puccinia coronata f. sp. avenae]